MWSILPSHIHHIELVAADKLLCFSVALGEELAVVAAAVAALVTCSEQRLEWHRRSFETASDGLGELDSPTSSLLVDFGAVYPFRLVSQCIIDNIINKFHCEILLNSC